MIVGCNHNWQDWAPKEAKGQSRQGVDGSRSIRSARLLLDHGGDRRACEPGELAPPCKHMRCYRLAGPIAGGAYLPVPVACDRDLEDAGAQGSESRRPEEPCGRCMFCVKGSRAKKTTLVACLGEVGKGKGGWPRCSVPRHTRAFLYLLDFAVMTRQQVRVGFLMGWRNFSRRHIDYCVRSTWW